MNLGKARVAYPFIEYSVQVTHHTERKSTAMEWMLLEIAQKTELHGDYANVPLENAVASIFSVADGNLLLRQVLLNLIDVNALKQITGFSDRSDWMQIRCGDLRLTEDGRRLQREGKLPAKAQSNNLPIVYDVVNNRLVNSSKGLSDKTANTKAKDIGETNMPGFPGSLINECIGEWQANGKSAPTWLQRNSRIDSIVPVGDAKIKWQNTSRNIVIDDNGYLSLEDEPNAQIAEEVLNVSDLGELPNYKLPTIAISSLLEKKKAEPLTKLGSIIDTYVHQNNLFVIAPQFSASLEGISDKICLIPGQPSFSMEDFGNGFIVNLPENVSEGFCYQDIIRCISSARVEGYIGDIVRDIPFVYEEKSNLAAWLEDVAKKYYMEDRRILKLLDYVEDVSYRDFYTKDFVCQIFESAETEIFTPVDKILAKLSKLDTKIKILLADVPTSASSETIRLALLNKEVDVLKDVREWTKEWQESLNSLQEKIEVHMSDADWHDTTFGLAAERANQITDAIAIFYDDAVSRYSKVYVFDTSALVHYPDVLDDFVSNRAMVIIPKTVLAELDGLKEADDEKTQYRARQAIKKIGEYRDEVWLNLNEDNRIELLSESYQEEGKKDFLILSVALKYRVKLPVMVTDDINFQTVAKSERIEAVTAHDLHESLVGTSKSGKSKKKKKNKG